MRLQQLLQQRSDLWQGRMARDLTPAGLPTGCAVLDQALAGGGWPPGSLIELLADAPGDGFRLVLPALARLSAQQSRWLLLVDPPLQPFAPALAAQGVVLERLLVVTAGARGAWAAEQGLRSGACAAVLLWGGRWDTTALRRLQLAAATGDALGFLFREASAARQPSPAPLRLQLQPVPTGYQVRVIKQRGAPAGALLHLP